MLAAKNSQELMKSLASIDISVPARTAGRTSEHTERYSVCRLLSTLSKSNHVSYPLSLKKRERPDYLLHCNGTDIGIEITEATSQDYCEYVAAAEKDSTVTFLEPGHFRHGSRVSRNMKNQLLKQTKLTSPGWAGDEVEKEWLNYVKDAILQKTAKAQKPEFEKFNENWLLVYDNTPTMFMHKELLTPYLEQLWSSVSVHQFNSIFVETSWLEKNSGTALPVIVALSQNSVNYFPLENLWP